MNNNYEIRGNVTVIYLTSKTYGNKELLIDSDDLDLVKNTFKSISLQVAKTNMYGHGKTTTVPRKSAFIHRVVSHCSGNMIVDHINHNGLDNRKSNLRIVKHIENARNRRGADQRSKSGVRGVHWREKEQSWIVRFKVNKKSVVFGYYKDFEKAKEIAETANSLVNNPHEFMNYAREVIKSNHEKNSSEKISGIKGINWHKKLQKWQVTMDVDGKRKYLGVHGDLEQAIKTLEDKQNEKWETLSN